ncbi:hypothetical protein MUA52_08450 [Staphylococcus agnetis]|uniref:hypothetical protein n=1 Tax=Staphylococcus agnetis TaxID=985762 RepID=UPI0021D037D7|nr:hypothetical protein [Staphylococcus agnetis]UXU63571.1 hypothetical protein MUA84_08515 [Staphylococcus agnetis]UXU65853.1 hypothetical protein MUA52_08450 [Staphylococcus agnetis]
MGKDELVLLNLYRDYLKRFNSLSETDTAHHFEDEYSVLNRLGLNIEPEEFHKCLENLGKTLMLHIPKNTFNGYPEFTLSKYAIDRLNEEFNADLNKINGLINSKN